MNIFKTWYIYLNFVAVEMICFRKLLDHLKRRYWLGKYMEHVKSLNNIEEYKWKGQCF